MKQRRLFPDSIDWRRRSARAAVALTLAVAGMGPGALAGECPWTGRIDSTWSNADNWESGAPPDAKDAAVFGSSAHRLIRLGSDAALAGIRFVPDAADAFTIDGGRLSFADGSAIIKAATKTPHNQTIASDILVPGVLVLDNEGTWVQKGNELVLSGRISGTGTVKIVGAARDNGAVTLAGDNSQSFTGTIDLSAGRLLVTHSGALGSTAHPVLMEGGQFWCEGGVATPNAYHIAGDVAWDSIGANRHTGTITVDKNARWTIGNGGGNAMVLSGEIAGTGSIQMTCGNTTLTGSASNTFKGTIVFSSNSNTPEYNELRLDKAPGSVAIGGDIELGGKAAVVWQQDNQLGEHVGLTLRGGVLRPDGHHDRFGALHLSGRAALDFAGKQSVLSFADSSAVPWASRSGLLVRSWAKGTTSLVIGHDSRGITSSQLADVGFVNPGGKPPGLYRAEQTEVGALVPAAGRVTPVNPPFDVSDEARKARQADYDVDGLTGLTAAGTPLRQGTRISIFGDSITWLNGYVSRIDHALAQGPGTRDLGVRIFNHGINGGGVVQIRDGSSTSAYDGKGNSGPQAAFKQVIESDRSDIAVVYIGVNDVWWRKTAPADFEQAIRDISAAAHDRGTQLVLATISVQGEKPDGTNPNDAKIDAFAGITRKVAVETGATLVDLRNAYIAYLQNNNAELQLDGSLEFRADGILTRDGVHPTGTGEEFLASQIARGILQAATKLDGQRGK